MVDSPYPDVYVIGFQEIVDLTAINLVADHSATKPWEQRIEKTLRHQYVKVTAKQLVGLSTVVYVKRELQGHVSDVQCETVGVGIMGVGGNKGGVGVSMRIFDSTFCFVNAHLAAHKGNVQGRNSDFHNIMERMRFGPDSARVGPTDHNFFMWLGDLNYRLNLDSLDDVYRRIEAGDLQHLLAHDQLHAERAAGRVFEEFHEGAITFLPTYKYQPGTALYERREDKKKRMPAWCDRILWTGNDARQLWYRRSELVCSDHKPVSALMELEAKVLIHERQEEVHRDLVRQLDQWENESIPKISVNHNTVHFADVRFETLATETVEIENTGATVVQYRMVPKLQEQRYCKQWLSVSPEYGIIPPGEKALISLSVLVGREAARALNEGEAKLEDILILRLEAGRDYFITVSGNYLRSCFGSTVEWLVKSPTPVRFTSPTARPSKVLSLPKEIWRVVDYLYPKALDEEDLFLSEGDERTMGRIRECLDTGSEFGRVDVHSMAETLTRLLASLAEPVFPRSLVAQFQPGSGADTTSFCKSALMQLSSSRYNVFIYIVSFLREVIKHVPADRAGAYTNQLLFVFSEALMHADSVSAATVGGRLSPAMLLLKHYMTSPDFC